LHCDKSTLTDRSPEFFAYYCLFPVAYVLLCLEYLFHSTHDGGLDFIPAVHHLFYAGSIDRVDLELGLFRLGQKLRIFQETATGSDFYDLTIFADSSKFDANFDINLAFLPAPVLRGEETCKPGLGTNILTTPRGQFGSL
jgi:hypothetical protein